MPGPLSLWRNFISCVMAPGPPPVGGGRPPKGGLNCGHKNNYTMFRNKPPFRLFALTEASGGVGGNPVRRKEIYFPLFIHYCFQVLQSFFKIVSYHLFHIHEKKSKISWIFHFPGKFPVYSGLIFIGRSNYHISPAC